MLLRGINLSEIEEKLDDNTYIKRLGEKAEITVLKKRDNASLLRSLGSVVQEDKFMIRYVPSNVILFDADLIDSVECSNSITTDNLSFTTENGAVRIGKGNKYRGKSGILCTSGVVDYYGRVESQSRILEYRENSDKVLFSSVSIVSLGISSTSYDGSDTLLGLMYIPTMKGYAVTDGQMREGYGISSFNRKERDCSEWGSHSIDEWFTRAKITRVEESYAMA